MAGGTVGGTVGGVIGGTPGGVIGGTPGGTGEGVGEDKPMHITADVQQPVLVRKVDPEYPEIARKARMEGVVILQAVITQTGTVEELKVLKSLQPVLDQAAQNAVRQWRYKPAIFNGHPVKVYFTVTVTFTLH